MIARLKSHAGLLIELIRYEIQLLLHRKKTKHADPILLNQIRKYGYCVIEDYLDEESCTSIRQDIDDTIRNFPEVIWKDEAHSDFRIFGAERASEKIRTFNKDRSLIEFGESVLNVDIVNHMTLAAKLVPSANNQGSGGGWHRDSPFENQFKCILYLSDVESGNGPYQYIEKSHLFFNQFLTLGYGRNLMRFSADEIKEIVNKYGLSIKTFKARKGTLIATNTRGLHRGEPINRGVRYALTNYYTPSYRSEQFASYFENVIKEPKKPF